jgi:predicted lipoprotein with Yx(FWY)xxD motif
MGFNRLLAAATATLAISLALTACGATAGSKGAGTSSSDSASAALIHTASMKIGSTTETVLKNQKGLTLYYFTPDTATTSACSGACAATWPPLMAASGTATSDPALPGSLGVINGTNQVVYNGHPLYTYSKDGDSGDAYGQGIGGKWFVATKDLAAATAAATATPEASNTYNPAY